MKVKVKPHQSVDAGEFVDKSTGEVIVWQAGFNCWVFLPNYEYPVEMKLPASGMVLGTEYCWEFDIAVKKGVARVQRSFVGLWVEK